MGHRTLVAYDRGDGRERYDLHYAHWGVAPGDVGPSTPLGGARVDGWARRRAEELLDPEGGRLVDDEDDSTAIDPEPIATGLSFGDVCERIDPLEHEALLVVGDETRAYLVVAIESGGFDRPTGALIGYDDESEATYLRGWLAGVRAATADDESDRRTLIDALRWLDPKRGVVVWLDRRGG
ncbi:MAG: hypothetical protein PPP58_06355 [Natronomonas sp.]